jgi:hypothetical protein
LNILKIKDIFRSKKNEATIFFEAFPKELLKDVELVVKEINERTYNNISLGVSGEHMTYVLDGKAIQFPIRMYFLELSDDIVAKFSQQQMSILHCIYSRNCNGYVRENHIKALLQSEFPGWSIPFIVKICDEYVVEILEDVYLGLQNQGGAGVKEFCVENKNVICKGHARMISYWNEYYRGRFPVFQDYIGKKLFEDCFGYSRSWER